ncbi:MarR family winged helix-turn-helix transcriptional regulator [Pseudactinotalea sp. Z1739]|uniref:MarR family winged helix-turn-helix transcriptional regulator n=1 Tax=Pseudactinotalea sp. Z1739 TaxID=3413028 RepID=UPI003C7D48B0
MSIRTAAAAWEALFRAQVSMMQRFEESKDFQPLRSREYDVLFNLARLGGRARQWELNANLLISQPSLSRMVGRLQSAGYVRREESPSDGREVLVVLTEAGAALQADIGRRHVRHIAEIVDSVLSESDQAELARLADAIQEAAASGSYLEAEE